MKKHFLLLLLAVSFNHIVAMDSDDASKEELDIDSIVTKMMPKEEFNDQARVAVVAECSSLVFVRPPQFYTLRQQGLDMPGIVQSYASSMIKDMRHAIIVQKNSPQWRHLVTAK